MIFISILILLVAIALPSLRKEISSLLLARISSIIFIFSGALSFNALYIQSIGSGIGIYSGLFHVTIISQLFDGLLLFLGSFILMAWSLVDKNHYTKVLEHINNFFKHSTNVNSQILLERSGSLKTSVNSQSSNLEIISDKLSQLKSNVNVIGLYTPRTEYSLIVLFSALGSSLLISAADLLSLYLSIELQSFSLYILATLYRDYESSTSSGLKYFLLGGLSSCFILLGCGLIYTFTGLTNFESIYSLLSLSNVLPINLDFNSGISQIISGVSLGILFIFIGFLFKIAAAPLHSWSPDVYDETPTQVTVWLTIIPKISILVLLLELYSGFSINSIIELPIYESILNQYNIDNHLFDITFNTSYVLNYLLLISSLISLLVGTIVGLSQTRIKRLFAYSTISHIGFILLALAINTEQSIESFLFYIIQYSLTNLNIFLIIMAFGYIINTSGIKIYSNSNNLYLYDFDIRFINTIKGQLFNNPILSFCFIICLFSMAGIPPLLGFFSKQFVLLSAVQSGYWFISFVAIITSVISASYYLRIVVLLVNDTTSLTNLSVDSNDDTINKLNNHCETDEGHLKDWNHSFKIPLTNLHSFLISILTLFILLFIFKPTLLLNSTQLLSLSLFYT
jgi:NADH-ubiquinone oxidoreductase chain 2